MANSILDSTKDKLGLSKDYTVFDSAIIDYINSVFFTLNQIGLGPSTGFSILDDSDNWQDFLGDETRLQAVMAYMYLKVRLLFDPPSTSFVIDSMNNMAKEMEWRLLIGADEIKNAPPPEQLPLPL